MPGMNCKQMHGVHQEACMMGRRAGRTSNMCEKPSSRHTALTVPSVSRSPWFSRSSTRTSSVQTSCS